jgi:hypothetical protein
MSKSLFDHCGSEVVELTIESNNFITFSLQLVMLPKTEQEVTENGIDFLNRFISSV